MATIYFTTNAGSGDGSLAAAIESANAGDTIQPAAPTLLGVDVVITSPPQMNITKELTLETYGQKVTITGATNTVFYCNLSGKVTINDFSFIANTTASNVGYLISCAAGELEINRAIIAGNDTTGGTIGGIVGAVSAGEVTLNDCAIYGNAGHNGAVFGASGTALNVNNSTVIGNAPRDVYATGQTTASSNCSIFQNLLHFSAVADDGNVVAAPSLIGFELPPADSFVYTSAAYENIDVHLLATSTAIGHGPETGYDQEGFKRLENGAAGAFEYYPIDCYIKQNTVSPSRHGTYTAITSTNVHGLVRILEGPIFGQGGTGTLDFQGANPLQIMTTFQDAYLKQTPLVYDTVVYLDNCTIGNESHGNVFIEVLKCFEPRIYFKNCTLFVRTNNYDSYPAFDFLYNNWYFTIYSGSVVNVIDNLAAQGDGETVGYIFLPYGVTAVNFLNGCDGGVIETDTEAEVSITFKNNVYLSNLVIDSGVPTLVADNNCEFVSINEITNIYSTAWALTAPLIALPPGTTTTDATLTGTLCDLGADLTSFTATPSDGSIVFEWTKNEVTPCVCIQQNQNGVWTTLAAKASGTTLTAGDPADGVECRAFDGRQFFRVAGPEPAGWVSILCSIYSVRD